MAGIHWHIVSFVLVSVVLTSAEVFSGNCNCTIKTGVSDLNCYNISNKCGYCQSEKELGIKVGKSATLRIPDNHMTASSQRNDYYGAARARIGMINIGNYKDGWCAGSNNPSGIWLQINFGVPTDIERIETKGIMFDGDNKWVRQYSVNYSSDGVTWSQYRNGVMFNSSYGLVSTAVYVKQTTFVRIISNSPWSDSCLQLAIYGCPGVPQVAALTDAPSTASTLASADKISEAMFIKGYQLWLVFLIVFLVLLLFSALFLLCMFRKKRRNIIAKKTEKQAELVSSDYVPPWRRIDAETEKCYVAKKEVQEIEVPFDHELDDTHVETDQYVDPDSQDFYHERNRVFSFSGRLTKGNNYQNQAIQEDA